jgi:Ser/Thr protein kinase RdoA (MazF antagonist)
MARREAVRERLERFRSHILPIVDELPRQSIHNDANDHNVLVLEAGDARLGLIDFGDMAWTARVCEPAIAMTYAMLEAGDPIAAAAELLAGYHETRPLERTEIAVLAPLIEARLCVSVIMSAYETGRDPDNAYLAVSEAPAWSRLEWLSGSPADRLTEAFLTACDPAAGEP